MPRQPRKLSDEEWDAINVAEAQAKRERKLGHQYKLTMQQDWTEWEPVSDKKFWMACTCGWMAGRWYPTSHDALVAQEQHKEKP